MVTKLGYMGCRQLNHCLRTVNQPWLETMTAQQPHLSPYKRNPQSKIVHPDFKEGVFINAFLLHFFFLSTLFLIRFKFACFNLRKWESAYQSTLVRLVSRSEMLAGSSTVLNTASGWVFHLHIFFFKFSFRSVSYSLLSCNSVVDANTRFSDLMKFYHFLFQFHPFTYFSLIRSFLNLIFIILKTCSLFVFGFSSVYFARSVFQI